MVYNNKAVAVVSKYNIVAFATSFKDTFMASCLSAAYVA